MKFKGKISVMLVVVGLLASYPFSALSQGTSSPSKSGGPEFNIMNHRYEEGEKIVYYMTGSNRGQTGTTVYQVQADGVVKKDTDGTFFEEYVWSHLVVDNKPVPLSGANGGPLQHVSFLPGHNMAMPDLSKVPPMLIGPITDLLTFYADMLIAAKAGHLVHAGDHFYFPLGTPNSWADGTYTVLGQDSIDFDITLKDVNVKDQTATIVANHVPPQKPQITAPVDWMKAQVADTPNNWVEVTDMDGGKYQAEIGKETFVVTIEVSMMSGKILSATMDNPVEVLSRVCTDAALTICGDPVRYQIRRQIEIHQ